MTEFWSRYKNVGVVEIQVRKQSARIQNSNWNWHGDSECSAKSSPVEEMIHSEEMG